MPPVYIRTQDEARRIFKRHDGEIRSDHGAPTRLEPVPPVDYDAVLIEHDGMDEALAALRLVLDVADASRPYRNRRDGGQRVYLRALGLTPEARAFLGRGGAPR